MIVRTGKVGASVPAHVAAIAEAQRVAMAERMAAQAEQVRVAFSPVNVPATKRQVRRRNYTR